MEKKLILLTRKVLIVLLVFWMILVFALSNQNGAKSSALSKKIAEFMCFGNIEKSEEIEPMIRKITHMVEFGIGAMIFYGILSTYKRVNIIVKIVSTMFFIAICSGLDEFHQSFIDSRNASYIDVIIDIAGGMLGTGACYLLNRILKIIDKTVKEDMQNINN